MTQTYSAKTGDTHILYCDCANADIIPADRKQRLREVLADYGKSVTITPDLCGAAARNAPWLRQLAAAGRLLIIACYPRAVQGLFNRAGATLDPAHTLLLNMRIMTAEEIIAILAESAPRPGGGTEQPPAVAPDAPDGAWRPWFPVIDRDRCTNCRQCLDFCLFGVYAPDKQGQVAVERPVNCKNNCPACARMCPALAIMFPKIDEDSPINGSDADAASAAGKVCLTHDQLFGEHTLARLRARQRPPLFKQP